MMVKTIRRGRFRIFAVGWDPAPGTTLRRAEGNRYGYDLHDGDVKLGHFLYIDAAVAEAKKIRAREVE